MKAMTARQALACLAALAVIGVLLGGCGGGATTAGGGSEGGDASVRHGGTLQFGLEAEPTTLDPFNAIEVSTTYVIPQINETLVAISADGKPEPQLATSWTTSPDGLTWTFQLRKGVQFSDGKPMTAEDVAFSIEQTRTGPYFASLYEPIKQVRPTSASTVVIETTKPMPALLADLGLYVAGIVPKNFGGQSAEEFGQNPVGTGPFKLQSWRKGQAIKLVANPNYWQPNLPELEGIDYTFTTDESARLAQLRAGNLDLTRATALTVSTGLAQAPETRVEESPGVWAYSMLLNQNESPFADPRARQAFNLALDREGMLRAGTAGKGTLGNAYLPPSLQPFHDAGLQPPARNVAKAKALLAEAVAAGADPTITIKTFNFDSVSRLTAQIAQQDLEEVGFTVTLQALEETAINTQIEGGEYEVALLPYLPYVSDPSELASFYLSYIAPGIGAPVQAQTKLVNEANVAMEPAKRKQLYFRLQEEIAAEESVVILNYQPITLAVRDEVGGLEFSPVGTVNLSSAGFTG